MSGGYPPVIGGKVPLNIRKIIKQVGFDNVYGTVTYVFDNWEVFRKCESLRYDCSPFPTAGLIFSSYFEMFYSFYVKEELPELLPRGDEKEET